MKEPPDTLAEQHTRQMRAMTGEMIRDFEALDATHASITRMVAGGLIIAAINLCERRDMSLEDTEELVVDAVRHALDRRL